MRDDCEAHDVNLCKIANKPCLFKNKAVRGMFGPVDMCAPVAEIFKKKPTYGGRQ